MLRKIINKWIIGGVLLLIIIAGGCLLWYEYTLAPYRQDAATAETLLQKWLAEKQVNASNKQQDAPVEADGAAPQRHVSDETQETVYEWQKLSGPELLELASKMQQDKFDALSAAEQAALERAVQAAFDALSSAQQEALIHTVEAPYWEERGLAPPPPGWKYIQDQDGYHLVKYGEPHIRINWDNYEYDNDHLLSDTEWEEYKALRVIKDGLPGPRQPQATPEIVALAKEWHEKLREKTWGPVPGLNASTRWRGKIPTQAEIERVDKITRDTYLSLIPPPRSGVIDYDVVDRLLIELKSELERR